MMSCAVTRRSWRLILTRGCFPAAGARIVASPYAKKLAREAGVDIGQAQGSGPNGRIVAADVQQLIESGGGQPSEAAAEGPTVCDKHRYLSIYVSIYIYVSIDVL